MNQTILDTGFTLANLQTCRLSRMIDMDYLLDSLAALRAEWLEATGGDLSKVTFDLGALFDELGQLIEGA